jgi:hypothetical protein
MKPMGMIPVVVEYPCTRVRRVLQKRIFAGGVEAGVVFVSSLRLTIVYFWIR